MIRTQNPLGGGFLSQLGRMLSRKSLTVLTVAALTLIVITVTSKRLGAWSGFEAPYYYTPSDHKTEHAHRSKPGELGAGTVVTMEAPDEPGYQFIQARALILIETADMGLVAVLPIGMAHISSVLLSVKAGDVVKKGDELAYFHFGGSDVVMVFQAQAGIQFTAEVGTHYNVGQKIAVSRTGM